MAVNITITHYAWLVKCEDANYRYMHACIRSSLARIIDARAVTRWWRFGDQGTEVNFFHAAPECVGLLIDGHKWLAVAVHARLDVEQPRLMCMPPLRMSQTTSDIRITMRQYTLTADYSHSLCYAYTLHASLWQPLIAPSNYSSRTVNMTHAFHNRKSFVALCQHVCALYTSQVKSVWLTDAGTHVPLCPHLHTHELLRSKIVLQYTPWPHQIRTPFEFWVVFGVVNLVQCPD